MTKTRALVILLRVVGILALFALVAVVMPLPWMVEIHRWLGLGEMPTEPVVEYLARSLSMFYALYGGLCLVLAHNIQRNRPLVVWFGLLTALSGVVLTQIDLAAGMPALWIAGEGPPTTAFGLMMIFLARDKPAERDGA